MLLLLRCLQKRPNNFLPKFSIWKVISTRLRTGQRVWWPIQLPLGSPVVKFTMAYGHVLQWYEYTKLPKMSRPGWLHKVHMANVSMANNEEILFAFYRKHAWAPPLLAPQAASSGLTKPQGKGLDIHRTLPCLSGSWKQRKSMHETVREYKWRVQMESGRIHWLQGYAQ